MWPALRFVHPTAYGLFSVSEVRIEAQETDFVRALFADESFRPTKMTVILHVYKHAKPSRVFAMSRPGTSDPARLWFVPA